MSYIIHTQLRKYKNKKALILCMMLKKLQGCDFIIRKHMDSQVFFKLRWKLELATCTIHLICTLKNSNNNFDNTTEKDNKFRTQTLNNIFFFEWLVIYNPSIRKATKIYRV